MPTTVSIIGGIADMGVTREIIDKALGSDPYVKAAVIEMTNKVKETWESIWDEVGPHPYETDTYRSSLQVTYETKPSGYFNGVVRTRDRKAFWLEYGTGGSTPTPEFAPARKTVDRLNGTRGSGESAPGQPSGKNWAGNVSS